MSNQRSLIEMELAKDSLIECRGEIKLAKQSLETSMLHLKEANATSVNTQIGNSDYHNLSNQLLREMELMLVSLDNSLEIIGDPDSQF